jgi:hypothetical protein
MLKLITAVVLALTAATSYAQAPSTPVVPLGSGTALDALPDDQAVGFAANASGYLRTSQTAGETLLIQAYDADAASWTTMATITAGNSPTIDLSGSVTIGNAAPLTAGNLGELLGELTTAIKTTSTINDLSLGLGGGAVATNTAVGASALAANTTGSLTTAFGYQAGASATTGVSNSLFGYQAGFGLTTATECTLVGYRAGSAITTGGVNTAIGSLALFSATTATTTVAVGRSAASGVQTGVGGVYIGAGAGQLIVDGASHTAGTNNTFVGTNVRSLTATESGSTVIGAGAQSEGSNTTTIGVATTTQAHIFGSLLHRAKVVNDTNGETLSASDASGVPGGANGQIYTNTGAAAQTFNLPAAVAGMKATFYFSAAADVNINPDEADQILGLTDAIGDAISSDAAIGSRITLIAIDSTNWAVFDSAGVWTDVN